MYHLLLSLLLFSLPVSLLVGQDMLFYADAMANCDNPQNREKAATAFHGLFEERLQQEGSFNDPFEELSWISIQYPTDSLFRCISWQLDLGSGQFEYFGLVQWTDDQFISFNKEDGKPDLSMHARMNWSEWPGGLIYNVHKNSPESYTLFTYRQLDEFTKLKVAESLSIMDGSAVLGQEIFQLEEGGQEFVNRVVLKYSADSNVTLNYVSESGQIIYDNLIPVMGRLPGQGPTQVSDGSYKAYRLENHKWYKIDKLFHQTLERPPRAAQTGEKRDLFGRIKN